MTMIPFGPTLPVLDSDLISSEIRNQLNALQKGDYFPLRPRAQASPDLTIAIGATLIEGFWLQTYQGTKAPLNYAGGNSPAVSAPTSNPRIDLLTIDSAGTLAWTIGTEAASPAAPNCPDGKIPICYVYCRVGMSAIYNFEDAGAHPTQGYIYRDVRPLISLIPVIPGKNYLNNATALICHRQFPYTLVKDVYAVGFADRWWGMATGTAVSAGTLTNDAAAPIGSGLHAFRFSGVTLTGTGIIYLRQRMTSFYARPFMGKRGSFSCLVYHDIGSAKNFTVTISKPTALNNWAAKTEIGNSGAISVPSDTSTLIKFENLDMNLPSGTCHDGLEVEIKVETGAITTKNVWFTELKFEPNSQCTSFIDEIPAIDQANCMEFTEKSQKIGELPWATFVADGGIPVQLVHPIGFCMYSIPFKVRKANPNPTIYYYDRAGNVNKCSMFVSGVWYDNNPLGWIIAGEDHFSFWHDTANVQYTMFSWYVPEDL